MIFVRGGVVLLLLGKFSLVSVTVSGFSVPFVSVTVTVICFLEVLPLSSVAINSYLYSPTTP